MKEQNFINYCKTLKIIKNFSRKQYFFVNSNPIISLKPEENRIKFSNPCCTETKSDTVLHYNCVNHFVNLSNKVMTQFQLGL